MKSSDDDNQLPYANKIQTTIFFSWLLFTCIFVVSFALYAIYKTSVSDARVDHCVITGDALTNPNGPHVQTYSVIQVISWGEDKTLVSSDQSFTSALEKARAVNCKFNEQ